MKPLDATNKVFVYGTLKSGHGNNTLLRNTKKLGVASTVSHFTLTNCGFPYMFKGEERHPVRGELYEVDEETLSNLDLLEGVEVGHYSRGIIRTRLQETGEEIVAWAYTVGSDTGNRFLICPVVDGEYQWPS